MWILWWNLLCVFFPPTLLCVGFHTWLSIAVDFIPLKSVFKLHLCVSLMPREYPTNSAVVRWRLQTDCLSSYAQHNFYQWLEIVCVCECVCVCVYVCMCVCACVLAFVCVTSLLFRVAKNRQEYFPSGRCIHVCKGFSSVAFREYLLPNTGGCLMFSPFPATKWPQKFQRQRECGKCSSFTLSRTKPAVQ